MKKDSGLLSALEIGMIFLVIFAAGAVLFVIAGKGETSPAPRQGITSPQKGSNLFRGNIVDSGASPGSFTGVPVISDEGCQTDPKNGLSNCTAGVKTPDAGILEFNYEHNMMVKPCLTQGDIVSLQENTDGTAMVTRTHWTGGGGARAQ